MYHKCLILMPDHHYSQQTLWRDVESVNHVLSEKCFSCLTALGVGSGDLFSSAYANYIDRSENVIGHGVVYVIRKFVSATCFFFLSFLIVPSTTRPDVSPLFPVYPRISYQVGHPSFNYNTVWCSVAVSARKFPRDSKATLGHGYRCHLKLSLEGGSIPFLDRYTQIKINSLTFTGLCISEI